MTDSTALAYTIHQPAFSGPLDLLLKLIERRELDITAVSLSQIADEYLLLVRQLEAPDPRALSEFLVIAARLLLIKSRALLPQQAQGTTATTEEDGEALAQQLREYQRYKQAAALLRSWEEQARRCYLRTAPPPEVTVTPRPLDVSLSDLLAAVRKRIQLRLPLDEPPLPLPLIRALTVAEAAATIRAELSQQDQVVFAELVQAPAGRVTVIVFFWALLELLKRRVVTAEQQQLFGPIRVGAGPDLVATIELP